MNPQSTVQSLSVTCFCCYQKGHYSTTCPIKRYNKQQSAMQQMASQSMTDVNGDDLISQQISTIR